MHAVTPGAARGATKRPAASLNEGARSRRRQNEKGTLMNTTTTLTSDIPHGEATPRAPWMRHAWLIAGGVGLATVGLAAGLAWRPAPPAELVAPASLEATKASLASNEAVVDGKAAAEKAPEPAAPAKPATKKPPVRTAGAVSGRESTQQHAAVCATCGVVEGVRE